MAKKSTQPRKTDLKTQISEWVTLHNIVLLNTDQMIIDNLKGIYKPSKNVYKWFCGIKEYYLGIKTAGYELIYNGNDGKRN